MNNWESSPFKYENYEESQPPNIILNKINMDYNNKMSNIITKNIRINTNPINKINKNNNVNDSRNNGYIKKNKNFVYPNNTMDIPQKNNIFLNNSRNINIYTKKKLSDGLISSSATSGVNSNISNTQKNNNIEYIENNTINNIENNNANNIYNIKTTNNKSTNILIKNIYSNDDYFNRNLSEGLLHLKDFEIYKSNKISQYDIENEKIKQRESFNKESNKPLSMFLIKSDQKPRHHNLAKSCETINRNKKFKSPEKNLGRKKLGRQLSAELNIQRNNNILGKISKLMFYFNKKRKYSDQIIIRGTRNEKGGVVDFTTKSPKKYYRNNRYHINLEAKNKTVYKYPKWKIISSAKIIQNWWRSRMVLYFIFLNSIRKIQQNYRNYIYRKKKEKNEKINTNKKIGAILIKKVLEVKISNLFGYVLVKLKNVIDYEQDDNIVFLKYVAFIKTIINYIKNMKKERMFSFIIKLKNNNKYYKANYLEKRNESNIYFEGKKKFLIEKNEFKPNNENKSNYYGLNYNYNFNYEQIFKPSKKYTEKEILKIFNIFYRILLRSIIDKIKKEANRRTLIKAFRDINKMKYPILFFSLLKIYKYANIKNQVMNSHAILIQRHYREYREKKGRTRYFNYY